MLYLRSLAVVAVFCAFLPADEVERILCYGDSITAAEGGWVSMLDASDAFATINAGRGGRRAVNAASELRPYLRRHISQPIDRVLLCLGVNDLPARDPRPGDEKVAICVQGMREAIDVALTRWQPEQVVLVAPCGVNAATMNETNLTKGYQITQPLLEQLEVAYRELADAKGIGFFSLLRTVHQDNYVDGLHPNAAGHQEIAQAVESFLAADSRQPLRLWYNKPAEAWSEALPIGNGHMGAMVFGGLETERIQFNDDTLWRGKPHDYVRQNAGAQLKPLQQMIFAGKLVEAQDLAREKFLSEPVRQMPFQPFGDLHLQFPGHAKATHYRRDLQLDSGLANVRYQLDGVTYHRQLFASYPDRTIVMRVTASEPGKLHCMIQMDSPHQHATTVDNGTLVMQGQLQDDGLAFESRLRVIPTGGETIAHDDGVTVKDADSITFQLVTATSFKNFQDISGDPSAVCQQRLALVASQDDDRLQQKHRRDYQTLFRRVTLDLGSRDRDKLPTDERWELVKQQGLQSDPAFAALYFQYGRYLLISSSRPGSQPANLQGVWNELLDPPWESKYTLNINCEMNYWPSQVCNLQECQEPLFDMIDDLVVSGSRTARKQYGARGWVVHHNTDLWRGTAPINNIDGVWPAGAAWLSHHLWDHYLYTGDKTFLAERAYPAMKSAALFFVDFLVPDPESGYLVTNPSHSPEQSPPDQPLFSFAPTIDNQLIRALCNYVIRATEILDVDHELAAQLASIRDRLPPHRIGRHGQLQEWFHDFDRPDNQHRHMSPLWALFPGWDITPAEPATYEAAQVLLGWRGDGSTGWSYAWRMPLWARVGDGDFAHRQMEGLLQRRTLPNLFDLCGPFQIDGNFGVCAGVAELLLQSHLTEADDSGQEIRVLDILPALPQAWPSGTVRGLLARGGFTVDIDWHDGKLVRAIVRSPRESICRIRCGDATTDVTVLGETPFEFALPPSASNESE